MKLLLPLIGIATALHESPLHEETLSLLQRKKHHSELLEDEDSTPHHGHHASLTSQPRVNHTSLSSYGHNSSREEMAISKAPVTVNIDVSMGAVEDIHASLSDATGVLREDLDLVTVVPGLQTASQVASQAIQNGLDELNMLKDQVSHLDAVALAMVDHVNNLHASTVSALDVDLDFHMDAMEEKHNSQLDSSLAFRNLPIIGEMTLEAASVLTQGEDNEFGVLKNQVSQLAGAEKKIVEQVNNLGNIHTESLFEPVHLDIDTDTFERMHKSQADATQAAVDSINVLHMMPGLGDLSEVASKVMQGTDDELGALEDQISQLAGGVQAIEQRVTQLAQQE